MGVEHVAPWALGAGCMVDIATCRPASPRKRAVATKKHSAVRVVERPVERVATSACKAELSDSGNHGAQFTAVMQRRSGRLGVNAPASRQVNAAHRLLQSRPGTARRLHKRAPWAGGARHVHAHAAFCLRAARRLPRSVNSNSLDESHYLGIEAVLGWTTQSSPNGRALKSRSQYCTKQRFIPSN